MLSNVKLSADLLKKTYDVRGSFYTLRYTDVSSINCRNGLEIFTKNPTNHPLVGALPDAHFVMMNPGNSRPWEKEYEPPTYTVQQIVNKDGVPYSWTKAHPDITQYQVMRVMEHMGWTYVRVSNLSDIRCAKSLEFKNMLNTLSGPDPSRLHSIFSQNRKTELAKVQQIKDDAPVIMAWGTDEWLTELASFGIRSLPLDKRRGLRGSGLGFLFLHASPTLQEHKDRWLTGILEVLRG